MLVTQLRESHLYRFLDVADGCVDQHLIFSLYTIGPKFVEWREKTALEPASVQTADIAREFPSAIAAKENALPSPSDIDGKEAEVVGSTPGARNLHLAGATLAFLADELKHELQLGVREPRLVPVSTELARLQGLPEGVRHPRVTLEEFEHHTIDGVWADLEPAMETGKKGVCGGSSQCLCVDVAGGGLTFCVCWLQPETEHRRQSLL